jgi:hypothetical protein
MPAKQTALFEEETFGVELPELEGTPEMIAFAAKIRHGQRDDGTRSGGKVGHMLKSLTEWTEFARKAKELSPPRYERIREELEAAHHRYEEVIQITDSSWWIERRKNTGLELLRNAPAKPGPEVDPRRFVV